MAEPVGFLGLSHLGLVSSIGWASFGVPVLGVDPDHETVDCLNQGRLPIYEPGLDALFGRYAGYMTFGTDVALLSQCPLVILSLDVPTNDKNASDLSVVEALAIQVIPYLQDGATLVVMNQVPPGFTRSLAGCLRRQRLGETFQVHYWVETLVLGRAVDRYLHPERIIIGCNDPRVPLPPVLDDGLRRFGCSILPILYESAELTKMAINLYLASAVTYANTLSDLCERIGADWTEVVPALRLDARIGPAAYLRPSLGIAGGNLERDLITLHGLAYAHGVDAAFLETIIDYNDRRYRWVINKLQQYVFAETPAPTIALWGLAYKKNTRSIKNSMSLRIIGDLQGKAKVYAYDPVVKAVDGLESVTIAASCEEAAAGADCVLIVTDWDEFAATDVTSLRRALRRPVVIDCVGVLEARRSELEGIQYISMGRRDPLYGSS